MASIITAVLQLLQLIIPSISSSTAIQSIINSLIEILPIVIKEVNDLTPIVKNIIAALKSSDVVTPEQITELEALDARCDQEFEAAATNAQKEDEE